MKILERIKTGMAERALNQKLKTLNRNPAMCNLSKARHIGILYNATEYVSFEIIRELAKNLSEYSEKVTVLGYVDSKELIDHYLYRKGFEFFSRSDLNWYYKPVSEAVNAFVNEPFDILINLSLEDHFPVRYITALSPAHFKAGRYSAGDRHLDFMIDIDKEYESMAALRSELGGQKESKPHDRHVEEDVLKKTKTEWQLKFLINQLLHYLNLIKN